MAKTIVIASGFFNPLHGGHIDYLNAAKNLGNHLWVIVNNNKQVSAKGSITFMDESERLIIIESLKFVDWAVVSIDTQVTTVCETLKMIINSIKNNYKIMGMPFSYEQYDFIFAKGGDRSPETMSKKELEICKLLDCEVVYGVGGTNKRNSSSKLIRTAAIEEFNKSRFAGL